MSDEMIEGDYEYETGFQIINCLKERDLTYEDVEMMLVGNHAPFTWGTTAEKAVYNSAVLESIAQMALLTEQVNPSAPRLKDSLIRKHFERKHGQSEGTAMTLERIMTQSPLPIPYNIQSVRPADKAKSVFTDKSSVEFARL